MAEEGFLDLGLPKNSTPPPTTHLSPFYPIPGRGWQRSRGDIRLAEEGAEGMKEEGQRGASVGRGGRTMRRGI